MRRTAWCRLTVPWLLLLASACGGATDSTRDSPSSGVSPEALALVLQIAEREHMKPACSAQEWAAREQMIRSGSSRRDAAARIAEAWTNRDCDLRCASYIQIGSSMASELDGAPDRQLLRELLADLFGLEIAESILAADTSRYSDGPLRSAFDTECDQWYVDFIRSKRYDELVPAAGNGG